MMVYTATHMAGLSIVQVMSGDKQTGLVNNVASRSVSLEVRMHVLQCCIEHILLYDCGSC